MKRRSWLWFVVAAILAILAGVLAMVIIGGIGGDEGVVRDTERLVVVARNPIAANQVIDVSNVMLDDRDEDEIPSGAAVSVEDVVGGIALQDIAQGQVILMQFVRLDIGIQNLTILEDKLAVVLPADDILSQWGAVLPGDHVDVLVTLDVILEKPMYPEDIRTPEELAFYELERDQSMDNVSVLALQNAEVLQLIEEPRVGEESAEEAPTLPRRAMILKVEPQDAVVLKYLRDNVERIDLALRSPENTALLDVQPVNINYLVLRYGIALPQPLD